MIARGLGWLLFHDLVRAISGTREDNCPLPLPETHRQRIINVLKAMECDIGNLGVDIEMNLGRVRRRDSRAWTEVSWED